MHGEVLTLKLFRYKEKWVHGTFTRPQHIYSQTISPNYDMTYLIIQNQLANLIARKLQGNKLMITKLFEDYESIFRELIVYLPRSKVLQRMTKCAGIHPVVIWLHYIRLCTKQTFKFCFNLSFYSFVTAIKIVTHLNVTITIQTPCQ